MRELDPAAIVGTIAGDQRLRGYVGNGRLEIIPARRSRRRLLLDKIVQGFQPGVYYPEHRVDSFLRAIHPDHAALRRYLVDEEFLTRANGNYWRSGGTVLLDTDVPQA